MNRIHHFMLMLSAASLFALTGCQGGRPSEKNHAEALRLIENAHDAKDYKSLMRQADSLMKAKGLTEAEAYYWQGYAYDHTMQHRMAEFYWKMAIAQTSNATAPEDLAIYAKSASRLANVLSLRGEYEAALQAAEPVVKRLEELKCDTTSDYTNLLIYVGCCQPSSRQSKDVSSDYFERAYQKHMKNIEEHRSDEAYKDAIAGVVNITYFYNKTESYKDALKWVGRYAELIRQYELRNDINPNYVDRQWARYDIYRATALDGQGQKDEAAEVYRHYLTTYYSQTPEGRIAANDYLSAAERWPEVADNYQRLDALLQSKDYSIETIQKMVLQKYHANMLAGRRDSAIAVSLDISEALDSAITQARRQDAEELLTISQKATELADEEAETVRLRTIALLTAIACLFALFVVYAFFRRQRSNRLYKKYQKLKATRTSENRSDLEQQVALNIQQAFTPATLPQRNDLKMFTTLKTANEAVCELYDYLVRDDKLYFCIGEAQGKGVPASLGIAIARSEFRSNADNQSEPGQVMEAINNTIANRQDPEMAVALFVGILDLATGRLRYTNAGHTAPLLVGSGIGLLPVDQNVAAGSQAQQSFKTQEGRIDPDTLIFLYTHRLTDLENAASDKYGQRRMMGESLQATKVLKEKLDPKSFVTWMQEAIDRFVGDGDADKEMTTLAIQYMQNKPGGPYQRSISLTSDPKDEPFISHFGSEVCAALHIGKPTSSQIVQELLDVTNGILKQTYPEGTKGDVQIEAIADGSTLKFDIHAGETISTLTKDISKQ